jgi:hypothetical protein
MSEDKELEKDVFAEAAMEQLIKGAEGVTALLLEETEIPDVKITSRNLDLSLQPKSEDEKVAWTDLTAAMTGRHALRFNKVLTELPDREFIRVYLKALEYFMPKVTRRESGFGAEKNPTINIQINRGGLTPESKIIDINHDD